jgi:hypothetical protein
MPTAAGIFVIRFELYAGKALIAFARSGRFEIEPYG